MPSSNSLKSLNGTIVYENTDIELVHEFVQNGYRTIPRLYVNGSRIPDDKAKHARPNQTLLSFLRDVLHLTGSKLGCGEGGCGACTVMVSRYDARQKKVVHFSANACLMPILAADGCHITTVEGVGSVSGDNLHPIQRAMVEFHGSQCGFCTPGIIVAVYSLFANSSDKDYIEEHLDGNLCRCTGYRPIWDAARSLCTVSDVEDIMTVGPCGTPCRECPERDECTNECNVKDKQNADDSNICCSSSRDKMNEFKHKLSQMNPTSAPTSSASWLSQPNDMFPKELMDQVDLPLCIVDKTFHKAGTWLKVTTLLDFLKLLKRFQGEGCKIVVGNTEVGIETKFKHSVFPRLISPSPTIESIFEIKQEENYLRIGSCVSLSSLQHFCSTALSDDGYARIAKPIHDMLRWFASTQIRNVACLGGNLATASPISDMNPLLASMSSRLVISSIDENGIIQRRKVLVSDFFLSYRTVDMKPYELIEAIEVPKPRKIFEYIAPFKQARRREDDISIVTSGMRIRVSPQNGDSFTITDASLAFGGMAPKTVMAKKTESFLIGKVLSKETFEEGIKVLQDEMMLPDSVPGGQAQYRVALASSFLFKMYFQVSNDLSVDLSNLVTNPALNPVEKQLPKPPVIEQSECSILESFVDRKKPSFIGTQKYPKPKAYVGLEGKSRKMTVPSNISIDKVGKPSVHASASLHCTGEAKYTDDILLPPGTLQATLILAKDCNGILLDIDATDALKIPGVVAVYTHEDIAKIGGDNIMGPVNHDEFLFLPKGEHIAFVGQPIGVCIADSLEASETGARSVKIVTRDSDQKAIISIEDAIRENSFYDFARHKLERSTAIQIDDGDEVVNVSGSFRCGGQEHFYLETNSTLAVPNESGTNMTIFTSTQAVTKTQMYCASTTNTPAAKMVVHMKRMGGGFGGKETRSVFASCAAAVAAKISNSPVRLTLSRDVDMSITGGRHSFLANYKASAIRKKDGVVKLKSLDLELYSNGGSALDLSGPVMDRAILHSDGPYFWPEFKVLGVPCKTSQPPHTAFRGFGGPQGLGTCEHVMDHLAEACNISRDEIRRQNLYALGESTPFGMILGEEHAGQWHVPTMFDILSNELDVPARKRAIEEFNSKNKWKKRGYAMTPTKFGIAFTAKFMNQGGALVHLYTDGTVLVSHGGTEMGQGLHTKVCQIAAQAFDIPLEDVYINDTSSDKVANTIPSAASMSTDMYGMACLDACNQILERLEPIRTALPENASLKDIATKAFFERVDLSAHGFFALDNSRCGFDWDKEKPDDFPDNAPTNSWKGHPFNYFTQGCAYSEVEIDVLTGNHTTLYSDVIVDVGRSINPALDIGQIEGAFIQGMGWSTIEEVVYGDDDHKWIRPRGKTFTTGPGTYKIPAFNCVPEKFNVTLMDNSDNPFAVHSSKAIGEPPFFLGASTFFAIKDAVMAARKDNNVEGYYEFRMPATSERIRMACADAICLACVENDGFANFQPKGSH